MREIIYKIMQKAFFKTGVHSKKLNLKLFLLLGILNTLFAVISLTPASAIPLNTPNFRLLDMTASDKNVDIVYDHQGLFFVNSPNGGFTFGRPVKVTDPNYIWLGLAKISTAENNIYILWEGKIKNSPNEEVLFTKSTDSGTTFASEIISNNTSDSQPLQLIAIKNYVYVSMMNEYSIDGKLYANVSFRASTDNGTTFAKSIDLLPNQMQGVSSLPPVQIQIENDGKTIYVIGEYFPDCQTFSTDICTDQIFFEKSEDFGSTFSPPRVIYSTHQSIQDLHTYASEKNVYVTWGEKSHDIMFMKSVNGGETFNVPTNLTRNMAVGKTLYPDGIDLAASNDNIYLIWGYVSYSNPPSLFLIKSNDCGNTFDSPMNLTENYGYGSFDAGASDNSLYLTWSSYQHKSEKTDMLFRGISDNGTMFDQVINLSQNINESSSNPKLTTTGNDVYVGWSTEFPGNSLLIGASVDNGSTFSNLINLGNIPQTDTPEFPYAIPVFLASIASLIFIYRMKFR